MNLARLYRRDTCTPSNDIHQVNFLLDVLPNFSPFQMAKDLHLPRSCNNVDVLRGNILVLDCVHYPKARTKLCLSSGLASGI